MTNTIIDNTANFKLVDTLKKCINTDGIDTIRIATGFWDIPGTALILDDLEKFLQKDGTKLKLLIGKDPAVRAKMIENDKVKYQGKKFPEDFIRIHIDELAEKIKDEHKGVINLLLKYCENGKIEIRIFKTNEDDERQFFHSKCYIFTQGVDDNACGIIGSSNFTKMGLQGNSELNYLETNPAIVCYDTPNGKRKGHVKWFEEKWEQADDWTKEFLEEVLKPSKIVEIIETEKPAPDNPALTPYEVYIKYLQTQFGDIVSGNAKERLTSYLPRNFDTLDYQLDAVQQCFYIMQQHGGFLLADVVGLGKTVVGVLIIKKFICEANLYNRNPKVLIVVPPAIKNAWQKTIEMFDIDAQNTISGKVQFVTTGSIGSFVDDDGNDIFADADVIENLTPDNDFGLIMIDESHNFRNSETLKYKSLDALISSITTNTGVVPFVGLLSATPQNNSPRDLKNQIYLFQRSRQNSTLPVEGGKLDSFFSQMERDFYQARKGLHGSALQDEIKRISEEIRQKVLDHITVRRTRSDIKKYYANDSANLRFPTVRDPEVLKYKMNEKLANLFAYTVNCITEAANDNHTAGKQYIGYYRYCAISYLLSDENRKTYSNRGKDVDTISKLLAGIMQTNLVKRLESSFEAFRESLKNLRQYTQNMIDMWDNDCIFICPDIDVNSIFKKFDFDFPVVKAELKKRMEKKNKESNREFKRADFSDDYIRLLKQDRDIIDHLCKQWNEEHSDPKFDEFKIQTYNLFNKEKNQSGKLVIFTEALATQDSIADFLEGRDFKVLKISAANRDDMQEVIRKNFDANCPKDEQQNLYDVIVTTEVLAEGVNLHRANTILNYDTPWNSTRLMQRIGRVNRIGSKFDFVNVYNFYPSAQSDRLIDLVSRSYAKLQAFHTMFGEDNKVYSAAEELPDITFVNIADETESPFAEFFADLKKFRDSNPKRYDYLQTITPENLGGQLQNSDSPLFAVKTKDKSVLICFAIDNDSNAVKISNGDFMQQMRKSCNSNFVDNQDNERLKALTETVKKAYYGMYNISITAQDMSHSTKKAQDICKKLFEKAQSPDAKIALKYANQEIKNGNADVIKRMLKLEPQASATLFDDGLDALIVGTFANTSNKKKIVGDFMTGFYIF